MTSLTTSPCSRSSCSIELRMIGTERQPNFFDNSVRLIEMGKSWTICPSLSTAEKMKSFTNAEAFFFLVLIKERPGAGLLPKPEPCNLLGLLVIQCLSYGYARKRGSPSNTETAICINFGGLRTIFSSHPTELTSKINKKFILIIICILTGNQRLPVQNLRCLHWR